MLLQHLQPRILLLVHQPTIPKVTALVCQSPSELEEQVISLDLSLDTTRTAAELFRHLSQLPNREDQFYMVTGPGDEGTSEGDGTVVYDNTEELNKLIAEACAKALKRKAEASKTDDMGASISNFSRPAWINYKKVSLPKAEMLECAEDTPTVSGKKESYRKVTKKSGPVCLYNV